MKRVRIIPVLLVQDGGLVKSINFKNHKYVGDPINAVKIFNDKEVDEIAIIDISATKQKKGPNFALIEDVANEAFMPMSYGGGITTLDQVSKILNLGIEKVILNQAALTKPSLITEIANKFGSQSVVVSIDYKKNWLGKLSVYGQCGTKNMSLSPSQFAKQMQEQGAGEIILTSIEQEGTFKGYDIKNTKLVADSIDIPLIACGGASCIEDFYNIVQDGHASAVAAGSFFVFQQPHRAVLISYPSQQELTNKVFIQL